MNAKMDRLNAQRARRRRNAGLDKEPAEVVSPSTGRTVEVSPTTPDGAPQPSASGANGEDATELLNSMVDAEVVAAQFQFTPGDGETPPDVTADGKDVDPERLAKAHERAEKKSDAPTPTPSGAAGESEGEIVQAVVDAEVEAADDLEAQPDDAETEALEATVAKPARRTPSPARRSNRKK